MIDDVSTPSILPPSQGSCGAEVYGSLAGLLFLAVVRRCGEDVPSSIGDVAREWLETEAGRLDRLHVEIQHGSGLSELVMADRVDKAFNDWQNMEEESVGTWLSCTRRAGGRLTATSPIEHSAKQRCASDRISSSGV